MRPPNTYRLLAFATTLLLSGGLVAQTADTVIADFVTSPNYFVVVLFGVMIAIGFQFLLTSLSIAIGVSAIPNLKETYVQNKYSDSNSDDEDWNETNDATNTGVMVSSALGIWNVVTAAISLFGATALALTLTPVTENNVVITLALTIWAVFYLLMFYLEGKMAGSLIGSLINTAVSGLRAGGEAVKNLFAPSPLSQIQTVADNTIEKLRQEMTSTFDTDSVTNAIDNFTSKVTGKLDNKLGNIPSYDKIKQDLKEVAKAGGSSGSPAKWTAIQSAIQSAIDSNEGDDSEEGKTKVKQLKELLKDAKGSMKSDGKDSKGDSKSAQAYVDKVTKYLETATPDSFDTEKLTSSIQQLTSDPQGAASDIVDQVGSIEVSKEAIVSAITKNTSLDKKQIDGYVEKVSGVLNSLKGKANQNASAASDRANGLLSSLEGSIAAFIDGTDDQRLNYSDLKGDFMKAFNNPNESIDIVSRRLETYDRDTLVSVLTNNSMIDRSDINGIVSQVEDARTQVMDQLQAVKDKANSTMNQTARRAAIQADGARKAAVAAAWWLFTAIVVSGVAAVLGSSFNF